jgi:hypothetical protein
MKKFYLGIDPGASGGIVVLNEDGTVYDVFKTPENVKDWVSKMQEYKEVHCMCITEKVHSQPHHGGKANFTFGRTVGTLLTIIQIFEIPFQEVAPRSWMKTYMMQKEQGETPTHWKNRLKDKAQQLFPKEKVTLWNADAFLIAEFCRRNYK